MSISRGCRFVVSSKDVAESLLDHAAVLRMRKDVQIIVTNCRHDASRDLFGIHSGADERGKVCRALRGALMLFAKAAEAHARGCPAWCRCQRRYAALTKAQVRMTPGGSGAA